MKIATWNVNSVKARAAHLAAYLKDQAPDVVLLQELKCLDADFPCFEVETLGYNVLAVGQKSYNGVAILSKSKPTDVLKRLPGADDDDQARYLEATVDGVRVAAIYLPNGNPIGTPKFTYKLAFMERLHARARELLASEMPVVMGGDYNVAPTDADVFDVAFMAGDALCQPESRAAFRKILNLGYTDALRALHPGPHVYTYWDYQGARFGRDEGLRIDHLLLSPQAADRLAGADVDKGPRAKDKASDHTPVWCELTG